MTALDDIDPKFHYDAGVVACMPMFILIMGLLVTGTIVTAIVVINPGQWLLSIIVAFALMTVVILVTRYRWHRGAITLEVLRHASRLLRIATSQSIQVTSWYLYKNSWCLGIQPLDDLPEAPVYAMRVQLPYSRIILEQPTPAVIFHDAKISVVRLQDGRTILLATEPNELERLAEHPLPLPPRQIPLLVQMQMLTCHGMGLMFLCNALFFIGLPFGRAADIAANGFSLALGGICFILAILSIVPGYRALRRLRYAPLGWARVAQIDPPRMQMGLLAPYKHTIHLRIRDQQHQEYTQQFIVRQWMIFWPQHTDIPVLFDPTGREKPMQLHEITWYCRFNADGRIVYHPVMVAMTVLYFGWAAAILVSIVLER
jgi:hypothetical protein